MIRRVVLLALGLLAAAAAIAPGASAQRPDVVIAGATEPGDRQDAGTSWQQQATVLNQGGRRAGRALLRGYLSADQAKDAADRMLDGSARTPKLGARRQTTLTEELTVPAGTPNGSYHVILCIDDDRRLRESDERNNCRPSGQLLGVGVSERGPVGAPGPQGPPGPPGPDGAGPGTNFQPIARTTIPLGDATVDLAAFPRANGDRPDGTNTPDEGSTSRTTLARHGPFEIVGSCKQVTNGDDQPPGAAFGGGGFDQDGDEAKVLVYISRGQYTMQGRHGPRKNIPAGEGTPADDGAAGGEGKHMALAVNHDPDPAADDTADTGDEHEWSSVYRSTDAFIVHSDGTQLILRVWAGIDVLGIGNNSCAFGGVLEVVA